MQSLTDPDTQQTPNTESMINQSHATLELNQLTCKQTGLW
jgi:hypothetical protein